MSSLPTTPHGHEAVAPSGAPSAASNKNAGLLGIAKSFGDLAKGVAHVPEDVAHAEHGKAADHPKDSKAHEEKKKSLLPGEIGDTRRLAKDLDKAFKAWKNGDLDDEKLESAADSVLDVLNWEKLRWFSGPIVWGLKKMLKVEDAIHGIVVDYDHIGDQIMHKLKKDEAAAKKGNKAIDRRALEGFCKGMDVDNLERMFRLFTNKTRFDKALGKDGGREELKKEIANLLDVTGEVDEAEVAKITTSLTTFLGDNSKVDNRITVQHKAICDIADNARTWLTKGTLDQIYGDKPEEYDMDYKEIGDRILKLNDKTLPTFLARIKKDDLNHLDIAIGDLLEPGNIVAELANNPGDLKAQISNLFNVNGSIVTPERLNTRAAQMKKKLKEGTAVDPNTATRDEIINRINTVVANLIAGDTLKTLYPPVKKEEGPKITINYAELGKAILSIQGDEKARETFARSLEMFQAEDLYEAISDPQNLADELANSPQTAATSLRGLFGLTGGIVTKKRVEGARDEILTQLGFLHPVPATGSGKLYSLARLVDKTCDAFGASGVSAIIEKTWAPVYDQFGTFVSNNVHNKDDQESFLKAYQDNVLRSWFPALFSSLDPSGELDISGMMKKKTDIEEVKQELTELFGVKGKLSINALSGRGGAILVQLGDGKVEPIAKYEEVQKTISLAFRAASANKDKLFEVSAVPLEVNNFGQAIESINEADDLVAFLKGFVINKRKINLSYGDLTNSKRLESAIKNESKRKGLVGKLRHLLGLSEDAEFKLDDVTTAVGIYMSKLGIANSTWDSSTTQAHRECNEMLINIEKTLKTDSLFEKLMEGEPVTPDLDHLGEQIRTVEPTRLMEMFEKMNIGSLGSFVVLRTLNLRMGSMNKAEAELIEKALRSLIGWPDGQALTPGGIPYFKQDVYDRLGKLPRTSTQASSNVNSLMQILSGLNDVSMTLLCEELHKATGTAKESVSENPTLAKIKVRSLAAGKIQEADWENIKNSITPKYLKKLEKLENENSSPIILGTYGDEILATDSCSIVLPTTRDRTRQDALQECQSRGLDLLTPSEYGDLQKIITINKGEECWLANGSDGFKGYAEITDKGLINLQACPDTVKSRNRGFRRVLRIPQVQQVGQAAA